MCSLSIDEIPVTCFRFEPLPEPLERLLDTSVFVVKLGEAVGRIELVVDQLGYWNALFAAAGRDVGYQAHALRFVRTIVVQPRFYVMSRMYLIELKTSHLNAHNALNVGELPRR